MRILASLILATSLLPCATAWADPVPADKMAYVGNWQGFNGNDFDIGFGCVHTTFVVSKPPHREGASGR